MNVAETNYYAPDYHKLLLIFNTFKGLKPDISSSSSSRLSAAVQQCPV